MSRFHVYEEISFSRDKDEAGDDITSYDIKQLDTNEVFVSETDKEARKPVSSSTDLSKNNGKSKLPHGLIKSERHSDNDLRRNEKQSSPKVSEHRKHSKLRKTKSESSYSENRSRDNEKRQHGSGKRQADSDSRQSDSEFSEHVNMMETMSAKVLHTFSGKIPSDKMDCDIRGIVILKDGHLLLLDNTNSNLKLFQENMDIAFAKTTLVCGTGMTKVSGNEVAIVGGTDAVYFYTIADDRITQSSTTFHFDVQAEDISYNREMYAILCNSYTKDPFIMLCSEAGEELNRVTSLKYNPYIVHMDSVEERLYVSPMNFGGKFTCLTQEGELLWKINFGGDVVEIMDFLLMTSFKERSLILCSKDGTYKRTLIEDKENLVDVLHVAYNADTRHIFVTDLGVNNNVTILLLQLSM